MTQRPHRLYDSTTLFVCSFIFLTVFRISTPTNGDTYAYAHSLSSFAGPSVHYGYFAIGYLFHNLLQHMGANPVQTLGFMSIFFGGLSVTCMYLFTFALTNDRFQSLLAGLILLFSGTFWLFAEHGEVYVPQLAIVLLSVMSMIWKKPLVASIFFLIAVSITPTSCLAFPPLLYLAYHGRLEKRDFLLFLIPIVVCFALLFFAAFHQIVEILKWAIYSPKIFFINISMVQGAFLAFYQLLLVYLKPFNLLFIVASVGALYLYRQDRKIFYILLSFILPFFAYILNLGLVSGDHLIITYIVVAFLASYGLCRLMWTWQIRVWGKWIIALPFLFVHGFLSYMLFIGPELRDGKELERVIVAFSSQYKPGAITFSEYNSGMAFWYLTHPEPNFHLLTGRPNNFLSDDCLDKKALCAEKLKDKFWINLPHFPGFMAQQIDHRALLSGRTIYFVDRNDWPTNIVKALLPKAMLEKRKRDIPQIQKTVFDIEKAIGVKAQFRKIIDSPLYPVYSVELIAGSS